MKLSKSLDMQRALESLRNFGLLTPSEYRKYQNKLNIQANPSVAMGEPATNDEELYGEIK